MLLIIPCIFNKELVELLFNNYNSNTNFFMIFSLYTLLLFVVFNVGLITGDSYKYKMFRYNSPTTFYINRLYKGMYSVLFFSLYEIILNTFLFSFSLKFLIMIVFIYTLITFLQAFLEVFFDLRIAFLLTNIYILFSYLMFNYIQKFTGRELNYVFLTMNKYNNIMNIKYLFIIAIVIAILFILTKKIINNKEHYE